MTQIIIVGCPRSGSTALRNLLNTEEKTFIANEMRFYSGSTVSFIERVTGQWSDKFVKQCVEKGIDHEALVKCATQHVNKVPEFLKTQGFNVVGDKFPLYVLVSHMEGMLKSISSGVKFIFCVRDCRDFICSSLSHCEKGRNSANNSWVFDNIKDACDYWVKMNTGLLNLTRIIPAQNYIIAQYEKSVINVYQLMKNINKLSDGVWDLKPMQKLKVRDKYHPVHMGRWITEQPKINDSLSDGALRLMELYGYEY